MLRLCDVAYFAPIFEHFHITESTISPKDFFRYARHYRRTIGQTFKVTPKEDDYTAFLAGKVNAMPRCEPPLTVDELAALFALLYEYRDVLPWRSFCEVLKYDEISFEIGMMFLQKWANHVVPMEPPTFQTGGLERLLDDLLVPAAMKELYCCSSIYEFNSHLRSMLPWDEVDISSFDIRWGHVHIDYPAGWTNELTNVLLRVKNLYEK